MKLVKRLVSTLNDYLNSEDESPEKPSPLPEKLPETPEPELEPRSQELLAAYLGLVTSGPALFPSESLSSDTLECLSDQLQTILLEVRTQWCEAHPELTHSEKSWVIWDAYTAACVEWCCRQSAVENSTMSLPEAFQTIIQCLQNNFNDRQSDLYNRIGRYTH